MEPGKQKGNNCFPQTVAEITQVGKVLKKAGIQLCYHNHDFEFKKFEGKFLLDWLYESVPADLLETEIDTCWVHYAGYNPADYVLKYSGRAHIVHLKDFVCTNLAQGPVYALIGNNGKEIQDASHEENGFEFRPIGDGIQNFSEILNACEKAETEYVIVEQDQWGNGDSMEFAKVSRKYLKSLGI